MRMQPWHLIILLVVVLLVFGAAKLPDITRNLGKSMKIFKQEVRELRDDADTINPASDVNGPAGTTQQHQATTPPPAHTPPQQDGGQSSTGQNPAPGSSGH